MIRNRIRAVSVLVVLVMLGSLLSQCGPSVAPEPTAPTGSTGGAPDIKPPPAVLEVDGQEQISGIGTYCWSDPEEGVAVCADMLGIITPENPLVVPASFTARFYLSPEAEPEELALRVLPVSAEDEIQPSGEGWRAWPGAPGEVYTLPLERAPEIELNLEPGTHVLELFARWEDWGDVSYGFLLEVPETDGTPQLTVSEQPIVAAEVDGPGHFEYTDRLGDETLARIEGLRNRDAERLLMRTNEALAPFGYRLESWFDAEWDTTFYDLYHEAEAEAVMQGLWHFWPVSVNASGTEFVLPAENAPNARPTYLFVSADGVEEWDVSMSNLNPPVYVGDSLAALTITQEYTFTYQVTLDSQVVYSGTAALQGAYHPLRGFSTWDGHWVLELDDHLILDGEDLGEAMGWDAAFGYHVIGGQPFHFFEQDGKVRVSYAGQTLPYVYDEVFHNSCCEAAIHNTEAHEDVLWFHALRDGTWYFVEAGVYDQGHEIGLLLFSQWGAGSSTAGFLDCPRLGQ